MYSPRPNHVPYSIPVFDGGLNTKYQDTTTPENQSPQLQDVVFDDFGAVGTRPGYRKLNAAAIATAPIDGLHEYINTGGTRILVAACNGSLYSWGGSTFAIISGTTGVYSAGVDVNMITVDNHVYAQNGWMQPIKWDGSNVTRIGVSGVTENVASVVSGGAGALIGTYRWAMTGVNANGTEGDYAVITPTFTAHAGYALLTGIPVYAASFGVATKNVYRTTGDTANLYYKVTAIAANVTTLTDNVPDSDLVVQAPSDAGPAPVLKFMIAHRNRVFGAGNETYPWKLYFSKQGDTEVWPSENNIDIEAGDGLPIVGIAVYGNALFIHKNDGKGHGALWSLYMPDSTDVNDTANWYTDKVGVANAGTGWKSMAFYSNVMFFMNRFGGYAFTGSEIARSPAFSKVGVFPVDSLTFLIEPDWLSFNTRVLSKAAAIDFDNKLWVAVPSQASSTNNKIYQLDYRRASSQENISGAWSVFAKPGVNCFATYDGDLYGGSSDDDGFVYKLGTGTNDAGAAINSFFYTVWISGKTEHTDNTKVWRYLYLVVSGEGDWDMTVQYWVDHEVGDGKSTTVNLATGGSLWDVATWDNSTWDGGQEKRQVFVVLDDSVGQEIQFKFSTNTADQKFKIHNLKLEYNLRRVRR